MAWTYEGDAGQGTEKVADTSLTITTTEDIPVGNLAVVFAAVDNISTSTGETNNFTISDESVNIWTKKEYTISAGAANDGATSVLAYCVVATQIDTGDDIIISAGSNFTSKCLGIAHWSFTESGISEADVEFDSGTDDVPSVAIAGLSSAETLFIGCLAIEAENAVNSADADYTNIHNISTTGGAVASRENLWSAYRVFTGTGDTWANGLSAARDYAQILIAIREVAAGGTVDPYPYVVGGYFPTEG